MKKLTTKLATAAFATAMAVIPAHAEQGITDTEILIGSNNDLSGPFASFGAPATKAAQLVFDEVNDAGGINGRKIRFIVEDHAYQMPKAIQLRANTKPQLHQIIIVTAIIGKKPAASLLIWLHNL